MTIWQIMRTMADGLSLFNQKIQTEGSRLSLHFTLRYEVLQKRWEHSCLLKEVFFFSVNAHKLHYILISVTVVFYEW